MSDKKHIKPEIVLQLTDEQIKQILPLVNKRAILNEGMILGSVGTSSGKTIGLSFIPQELALKIADIAFQELGEKTDVSS